MADNFLERRREDYERRKLEWLRKGKRTTKKTTPSSVERPEDETL